MSRKFENDGRDQINIENFKGNFVLKNEQFSNRSRSEVILLKAVNQEIILRLNQSLHETVLINLDKQTRQEQVRRPWETEIKIGLKPISSLPAETKIIEVFDHPEIIGKFLILGEPGSGKTTTLLELAKELIYRAKEDNNYPIPILFNLSSWHALKQSINDWLVEELKSKYGVRKDVGIKLFEENKLLPLLDGLDEVRSEYQELCVREINQWLSSEYQSLYLVVCSRNEEYSNYSTRLSLNGAIFIKPLTEEQINTYLSNINQLELRQVFDQNRELKFLAKSPLLLSIIVLAYQDISYSYWRNLDSKDAQFSYLLSIYAERMLSREIDSKVYLKGSQIPSRRETSRWLTWLARYLQNQSETEFLTEKLQPSCLSSRKQRLLYAVNCSLSFGLVGGIGSAVFGGLNFGSQGLFIGLTTGGSGGLAFGLLNRQINVVETLNWSWSRVAGGLIYGLSVGVLVGLSIGLIFSDLVEGLTFGLLGGLAGGIPLILIGTEIETRVIPNQGIWQSAKNSILFSLIGACGMGIAYVVTDRNILLGLLAGLPFGLLKGSVACIQHFNLRFVLWLSGSSPLNYSQFLDYCTERLFLQRIGGRYRFIHKFLEEYFANTQV